MVEVYTAAALFGNQKWRTVVAPSQRQLQAAVSRGELGSRRTDYETAEHCPLRKRGSRVKWLIFIDIVGYHS
jgi:hypothetical protein